MKRRVPRPPSIALRVAQAVNQVFNPGSPGLAALMPLSSETRFIIGVIVHEPALCALVLGEAAPDVAVAGRKKLATLAARHGGKFVELSRHFGGPVSASRPAPMSSRQRVVQALLHAAEILENRRGN